MLDSTEPRVGALRRWWKRQRFKTEPAAGKNHMAQNVRPSWAFARGFASTCAKRSINCLVISRIRKMFRMKTTMSSSKPRLDLEKRLERTDLDFCRAAMFEVSADSKVRSRRQTAGARKALTRVFSLSCFLLLQIGRAHV